MELRAEDLHETCQHDEWRKILPDDRRHLSVLGAPKRPKGHDSDTEQVGILADQVFAEDLRLGRKGFGRTGHGRDRLDMDL